jgi:phosphatidylglycerophosphatase C
MTENKALALFDFDGTITKKDTFLEFIRFTHGSFKFWWGMFIWSPVLILYKIKLIRNDKAKMDVFNHFYGNWDYERFKKAGEDFCKTQLPIILRRSALEKIKFHQNEHHRIIVVTASPKEWVQPWCKEMGIELISTEIEVVNNKITGKLACENCYGPEKVKRIHLLLSINDYDPIYAYGDSAGDKEMLSLTQNSHYKHFKD